VYGQSVRIGTKRKGRAQHIGLGKNLMKKAEEISKNEGFNKISVISSIGTREYYEKNGFSRILGEEFYQYKGIYK
jgi:elongator complex protein 3